MIKSKNKFFLKQSSIKLNKAFKTTLENREKAQTVLLGTRRSLRLNFQVNRENSCDLKEEEKHALQNFIEVEDDEEKRAFIPQIYFGTASPFLQSVVLCHILSNHFSLFEQFEMRRVCRLWHYNVKHIWAETRSLVLTLKGNSIKPKLSSNEHKPNLKFKLTTGKYLDSLTMSNRVELTIGKNHWNHATIDLLGDLFRNIEHLTIFYELSFMDGCLRMMCYFLQKFTKVKSFSLIMSPSGNVEIREDILSRVFEIINVYLAPLHTLHIYLPNYITPFIALETKHLYKTFSMLQNFSLNCSVENLGEILQSMGKSLPACWPIQSLSINVRQTESLSPVSTLFEQNSNLSQIKRLELTGVNECYNKTFNLINSLMDHFTQLECLYLCRCSRLSYKIQFTTEWIQILNKLPHLTELFLWDFEIQIYENWEVKSLPNISKLTVVPINLAHIRYQYFEVNMLSGTEPVEPRLIYGPYLNSFAKQFPRLEQLTLKNSDNHTAVEDFAGRCFVEFCHLKIVTFIREDTEDLIFTS